MSTQSDKTAIAKALDVFIKATEQTTGFVVEVRQDISQLVGGINSQLEDKFTINSLSSPHELDVWRKEKGLRIHICSKTRKIQVRNIHKVRGGYEFSEPNEKPVEYSLDEVLPVIAQKMADIVQYDPQLVKKFEEEKPVSVSTKITRPSSPFPLPIGPLKNS
ncbi:MAG: hypothetical protein MRY79_03300 [Alphaproteobacteria bacterium]|nr:hypothetical protein [Alphaproteobacteria bacterium]